MDFLYDKVRYFRFATSISVFGEFLSTVRNVYEIFLHAAEPELVLTESWCRGIWYHHTWHMALMRTFVRHATTTWYGVLQRTTPSTFSPSTAAYVLRPGPTGNHPEPEPREECSSYIIQVAVTWCLALTSYA